MQHLDPESLSLHALGEPLEPEATDHLRSCPGCEAEYSALRRTVVAAKSAPNASGLENPGPHVWAGIHRTLGLSVAVAEDPLGSSSAATPPAGTAPASATLTALPTPPLQATAPPDAGPDRNDGRPRSNKGPIWLTRPGVWLAAAAATALVIGGVYWSTRPIGAVVTPLATAQLAPLDQHSATGSARVLEAKDGQRSLEVTLTKDEAKGYQEVWLIAPDQSRLVSLGILTSDSGTFPVPPGLNLADYPIVDVSDEPIDGNPAHSSVSIVRGTLGS